MTQSDGEWLHLVKTGSSVIHGSDGSDGSDVGRPAWI